MSLLHRSSWRYYRKSPWQLVLCILGVAVGVAVVLAIDLANRSAEQAFAWAARTVSGRATHQVVPRGLEGLDENLYARLRLDLGIRALAPVVQGMVRVQRDQDGAFVTTTGGDALDVSAGAAAVDRFDLSVLGIDPLAEAPLRPWASFEAGAGTLPLDRWLVEPGAFVVSAGTAERVGLTVGQTVPLRVQGRWVQGTLIATLAPTDPVIARGLDQVLIADVATAQEWLGRVGRLDRMDGVLDSAQAQAVVASLPEGVTLRTVGAESGSLAQLTRAFRTNLQALSLLALVVGAFLIYNTLRFAVIQRRLHLGILRALGVTRGRLFAVVLLEALVLGGIGTGLGLLLGVQLAQSLVGLVAQTINDLYTSVAVTEVVVSGSDLLRAAGLGLLACAVAALAPAYEATTANPRDVLVRSQLERGTRARVPRAAWIGALCFVVAWVLVAWDGRSIGLAYGGLFFVLLGAAALTPMVCLGFLRLVRWPVAKVLGTPGSLAARGAAAGLSRTAVAVAALMLAVATTVGLGMMIGSFRGSVASWLESALVRDVYITVPAVVSDRNAAVMDVDVTVALEQVPGVAGLVRYRRADVEARLAGAGDEGRALGPALVVAYGPVAGSGAGSGAGRGGGGPDGAAAVPYGFDAFEFLAGDAGALPQMLATRADLVWISEPFAFRHSVGVGDGLSLQTPSGWHEFEIVGVMRDYGSEQGIVMMNRELTWLPRFADPSLSSLALDAAAGAQAREQGAVDELVASLRQAAIAAGGADPQSLSIRSNADLRRASLEVFDRTFAVTAALRLLCMVVAFLGIWSALMALQWERRREVALLRSLGAVPRQVAVLVLTQTGLLGLCAGLLAVPVGGVLGWVLADAINRRSFGWTLLEVGLPWGVALEAVVLAVVAALCAGLWPAFRLGRIHTASALRTE